MRRAAGLLAALALPCAAAPWDFAPPLDVTSAPRAGVFHHLESAGRRSIAVSDGTVAVAWEDNAAGAPRCRVALLRPGRAAFDPPVPVSGAGECFEPAVVALPGGRFALAWEEDGAVWARLAGPEATGPAVRLSAAGAQATLAAGPRAGLWAAWAERQGPFARVVVAQLAVAGDGALSPREPVPVDPQPPADEQLYPALALAGSVPVVAWEDRRHGHTVILWSSARDGRSFAPHRELNKAFRGNTAGLGRGSGAMRPALAAMGGNGVAALWSDKRDFLSGYDVYAGISRDAGAGFGANEKVQDGFGNDIAQWHPALAAAGELVLAAWDDDRDGSADIWLSWRAGSGWSDDLAVPGASGDGIQSDPAIALDEAGNLHLAWVERSEARGPTRIRYALGRSTSQ